MALRVAHVEKCAGIEEELHDLDVVRHRVRVQIVNVIQRQEVAEHARDQRLEQPALEFAARPRDAQESAVKIRSLIDGSRRARR